MKSLYDSLHYTQQRSPHLHLAHAHWKEFLKGSEIVIDATCGNGKDTEVLSRLVPHGHVFSLDIQEKALEIARARVTSSNVTFLHQSHTELPCPANLVVYNLGYLPGGDKTVTTLTETTLHSLTRALNLASALSITCYPGHVEGAKEAHAVTLFLSSLDDKVWKTTSYHGKENSPIFFWITQR